ncbi:MAG: PAS domain S-box protein [Methylocella sp.]
MSGKNPSTSRFIATSVEVERGDDESTDKLDGLAEFAVAPGAGPAQAGPAQRIGHQIEERLRLALGAAEIGTYELDLSTMQFTWDARAAAIWGRNVADTTSYELLASQALKEDRAAVRAKLLAASEAGGDGAYNVELRMRRHNDGALRWVSLQGCAFFENERPVRRVGVMLDITARKQSEAANDHLAAMIASSSDAIYSMTLDGLIMSWNASAERILGYSADAMIGRSDMILVPPDRHPLRDALLAAVKSGAVVQRQTKRLRKDGTVIDALLSMAPVHSADGSLMAISVLTRDITAEKRVVAQLEEAHAQMAQQTAELDAIFEVLSVPITVYNRKGEIVRTNAASRAVWGIGPDASHPIDFQGVASRLSVRNSDGEAVDPTRLSACRALTDDIIDRQEFQITSPTGRRYDFDAAGLPLIVDGNVTGAVSVWHDITEHKRKDEQNSILLRELAHRSKNLLSVIGSILRQSVKSTGSSEDFVARFSERLHALSNSQDLLARNNSLSVSMTDLIFSQVGHHWEPGQQRISMNGLGVRLRHDAAQMIGMALHELSTNAAKYGALSNQRGRVAIEWKIDHDAEPEPMFQLQWVERGGPPVIVPERRGFGTTIIQRVAAQSLNGRATLDYLPEGVEWVLRAPQSSVADNAHREASPGERIKSPALERLERLWLDLHGGARLPRLADFEHADIERADDLIIAAVDHATAPPAIRFVSIGDAVIERLGRSREECDIALSEAEIIGTEEGAYRRCVRSAKPGYEYAYFSLGHNGPFFLERLLLPFSDDGEKITHVVCMTSFEESASA